jgi:hypothetical protein
MLSLKNKIAASCALLLALSTSGVAQAANPLGIAFKYVINVEQYGKPTGMLITGRCNRYDPAFAEARAKGAEVLAYVNPVARPDTRVCKLDNKFYMDDLDRVPLWPYPSYGQRISWPKTRMTDIRAGSEWSDHVVKYVEDLMREGKVDGVFLDTVGVRPWAKLADWENWPQSEKAAYAAGNVDLVRRLDASRREINKNFLIIANNLWEYGSQKAVEGERYIDGVMIEHPPSPRSALHVAYAKRPFGNLGHRRVLVIANTEADAQAWAKLPGVTHVSDQTSAQYKNPNPPRVPFEPLKDRQGG